MAEQTPTKPQTRWQRIVAGLPTGLALLLIAAVWAAGAVWSFEEQTRFAGAKGFEIPQLLPLVLDGMAVAMAAVAYAASLDARPAVFARLGTALAVACSSASNTAYAWERSNGDPQTIALAAGIPVVANLAFEVLLAEVRRQVLRRRGQPGPVAITYPRLIRFVLAPLSTFTAWRRMVLAATDPARTLTAERPPVRVAATVMKPVQTPAPVETGPKPAAITDQPHQTPDPRPRQSRTPVRTAGRAGLVRPPTPVRLVQSDRDEPDLAKLRQWRSDNNGRMPSLKQIEQAADCGRSKAIRLRDRLAATTDDRAAV